MLPAEIALPAQTAQWLKAYRLGGRSSGRVSNRSGVGRWAFRPPDSELCYAPYAQILPPHAARAALAVVQGPAAAAGVVLAGACAVLLVLRGGRPLQRARVAGRGGAPRQCRLGDYASVNSGPD